MSDPLSDLLEAALIEHGNVLRGKRALRTPSDYDSNYRASFTKPDNWQLCSQIRLIHAEDNVLTLIGLFDEFKHIRVPRCRRLVAAHEHNPALSQSSEQVYGDHWLGAERLTFKHKPVERKLDLVADLTLEMGQHLEAQTVEIEALLVGGGLQRVVLVEPTIFEGQTPRTILQLPKGMDILEGLSSMCKQVLWRQIGDLLAQT